MSAESDPATPRFAADEPRVGATPFGKIGEQHPLRRAIRGIEYPVTTERVLSSVRAHPDVSDEQFGWLEAALPTGRRFGSEDEVIAALGAWGPPPPTTPPAL